MQRADRQAVLARRWLSKARTDLVLATVVLERDREGLEGWAAAFHAQQALVDSSGGVEDATWEEAESAVVVAAGVLSEVRAYLGLDG